MPAVNTFRPFPWRSPGPRAALRRDPRRGARRSRALAALAALLGVFGWFEPAAGQSPEEPVFDPAFEVFAAGGLDSYLRTLQNVGLAAPHPWSIRGFSSGEVRGLRVPADAGPWAERFHDGPSDGSALEYGVLRPRATALYNSRFPHSRYEGPIWAGRGLTSAVQAGGFVRYGPVSLVVAPVAFRAENRAFPLAPAGSGGLGTFRSPLTPTRIDLPQRFGNDPYQRIDPGNSTLRLDLYGFTAGVSTAAQQWGPAQMHPLVLGANAGGYSHLFLGTGRPRNVGIGRVHARYVAGRLEQSEYSPAAEGRKRRFMGGFVAVFLPRGVEGLEVGVTRFFHLPWPEGGPGREEFLRPFETVIKENIEDADITFDSQLASVFARWNFPGAGFELFGEYVRVDHSWNVRTFVLEPDDQAGYALGFRRVWRGDEDRLTVLRGEVLTSGSSHRERGGARIASAFIARPIYHHHQMLQGHTHRGQLLATPVGHFGIGSTVGVDRYHREGRWSVEWERIVQRDRSLGQVPEEGPDVDVTYALGVEVVRFRGPVELFLSARGAYNLNRDFGEDVFNLGLKVGATVALR
jgi:hypothetical protein